MDSAGCTAAQDGDSSGVDGASAGGGWVGGPVSSGGVVGGSVVGCSVVGVGWSGGGLSAGGSIGLPMAGVLPVSSTSLVISHGTVGPDALSLPAVLASAEPDAPGATPLTETVVSTGGPEFP